MPPNHPARDMQDTFYINTTGMGNSKFGENTVFLIFKYYAQIICNLIYIYLYY